MNQNRAMPGRVLGATGAVLASAGAAMAQTTVAYQDAVGVASPVWDRPYADGSGLSGRITGVVATPFYVSASGSFQLRSSQSWDGLIFVYKDAFNPAQPLANYIAGNDDDSTGPYITAPGGAWTAYSRIPAAALTAGTQYFFVTSSFASGNYGSFADEVIGPGVITMALLGEPAGSCVRPDSTCYPASGAFCASQGGTYLGNGSACPLPGACCKTDGTCASLLGAACLAQGGTFRGDGVACASANCPQPPGQYSEQGEAGDLITNAQVPQGTGVLSAISGLNGADDADVYNIRIVTPTSFSASTAGNAAFDTQLFLFNASGRGVVCNDDASGNQSIITSALVTTAGDYYLALTRYNRDAISAGGLIFGTATSGQVGPTGTGASQPLSGWSGSAGNGGAYKIVLTGCEFVAPSAPACYVNCDGGTAAPFLNVADFTCFLTRYAAGDPYANCDVSTGPPALNVADFTCFLTKFAAGCSAP